MNILLIVDCYLPSPKSSAKLIADLAKEFVHQGHTPTIIAPDESVSGKMEVRQEDGLEIVRFNGGAIKGASLWRRGFNEARLSSRIWSQCGAFLQSKTFDLIVFYSPSIFFGRLVERLKRLYECPSYLILRDIFPQWAVDAGVLRKGPAYWYFKYRESEQYRAADVLGIQSPENLGYFRGRKLGPHQRLEVLYNWMSSDPIVRTGVDHLQRWNLKGKIVLFYGGNIGVAQDCGNLLRLAQALGRHAPDAHVLFVGEGSEVPQLHQVLREQGIANVTIREPLAQSEYLELTAQIDIGLVSLHRDLTTQNIPGKILSYAFAGKPILASVNPGNDLQEIVGSTGAGLVSLNGDDEGLLANALKLIRDPRLRADQGRASRKLLDERFSVSAAARQILSSVARL